MLSFITETTELWTHLQETAKPIVLYGMGNGADKILDICAAKNIQVKGLFASDDFVRDKRFRGFKVEHYADMVERFGQDMIILIAFASELPELLERFRGLTAKHEVLAPHLPLFEEQEQVSLAWLTKYEQQLQHVYEHLADDWSRKTMACILNYKLSGKITYLYACASARREDIEALLPLGKEEAYLDLGAYNGDTVQEFLELTEASFKRIVAVEPDRRNFRKLCTYMDGLKAKGLTGTLEAVEKGIGREEGVLGFSDSGGRQSTFADEVNKKQVAVTTIDSLSGAVGFSYIKLDVEGMEKEALAGGARTIACWSPKLFVAAYHFDVDIFALPILLWQLQPDYRIYLRKHPYVPAWELNFLVGR